MTHQLHISGRLTLLRTPSGSCGDWISHDDTWYRRLDAHAFLWLRSRVQAAIELGSISEAFTDAMETLGEIAEIGIGAGSFTADEIGTGLEAPDWYTFNAGLPRWADDVLRI